MKSHTEYLWFNTQKRREYINITGKVEKAVRESGIKEGTALVSVMHITAGVYVNDAEPGIIQDIDGMLEKIAPFGKPYRHHQTGGQRRRPLKKHPRSLPGNCSGDEWQIRLGAVAAGLLCISMI